MCVQGLGKRLVLDDRNQHKSQDIVTWKNNILPKSSFHTTYTKSFDPHSRSYSDGIRKISMKKKTVLEPLPPAITCTGSKKELDNKRRYPQSHIPPKLIPSLATSTSWYIHHDIGNPYYTPLSVLATSQVPHLPANPWRYSFKQKSNKRKNKANMYQTI